MSNEGKRLRVIIAARPHRRLRLSAELRDKTTAYARRRKEEGARVAAIARELGVSQPTVARWLTTRRSAAMEVVGRPARVQPFREVIVERRDSSALTVVSPAGYRVEGLSLEQATIMLRALG